MGPCCFIKKGVRREDQGYDSGKSAEADHAAGAAPYGGKCISAALYCGGHHSGGAGAGSTGTGGSGCRRVDELDDAGDHSGLYPGVFYSDRSEFRRRRQQAVKEGRGGFRSAFPDPGGSTGRGGTAGCCFSFETAAYTGGDHARFPAVSAHPVRRDSHCHGL